MKKIFSLVALMVYIFSINTLVHASTMGFFSHTDNEMNMGHCQNHQKSSKNTTQNINCCEFATSSDYSSTQIQLEYTDYLPHTITTPRHLYQQNNISDKYIQHIARSPGRNPDIKYNKFSDLIGIIVHLS